MSEYSYFPFKYLDKFGIELRCPNIRILFITCHKEAYKYFDDSFIYNKFPKKRIVNE